MSSIYEAGARPARLAARARATDPGRAYLATLGLLLAGYAIFGKGFAYLGVAPLLITEVALLFGLVALHRSGCVIAAFASFTSFVLLLLITLATIGVLVGAPIHGMDAPRDGITVIYGLFAVIVIALLLEDETRLAYAMQLYFGFAVLYAFVGGAMPHITIVLADVMPLVPGTEHPLITVRYGEAAVHLAGAAIVLLFGMRRASPLLVVLLALAILSLTPSRGAMVSCVVAVVAAAAMGGKLHRFAPAVLVGSLIFAFAYAIDLNVPIRGERDIGPRQLVENVISIFGASDHGNLEGTQEFRMRWWQSIIDYTFFGDYFWTGKGFGVGLAESDGFVVGRENGGPILRSPHNAHFTILARMGVPGIVLWVVLLTSWFVSMAYNVVVATRRRERDWAFFFIWVSCYFGAITINASVDVALEGPMQGVWFWALFGLGAAGSMIYRFRIRRAGGGPIAGPFDPVAKS